MVFRYFSRKKKIVCFAGDELIVTCNAIPGPYWFSLTHIYISFFLRLRFVDFLERASPAIELPMT